MSGGGPLTPVGQVLSMQGGALQLISGSVFSEKIKVTKSLQGGDLSLDMVKGLLGGSGLSSIMQNPASGITDILGQFMSQITSAQQQLGSVTAGGGSDSDGTQTSTPAYPLTQQALTGLLGAAQGLLAGVQGLAGTGSAAPYGPLDLVLHATSVGNLGEAYPTLAFSAAAAPLLPTVVPLVEFVQTRALAAATDLTLNDDVAAAVVTQCTSDLGAIMATSTAAIGGLRDALVSIAFAQAVGGALVSDLPGLNGVLADIVQPAALADLKSRAEAEYYIEPPVWTNTAPLINNDNATVQNWLSAYSAQTGTLTVEVI